MPYLKQPSLPSEADISAATEGLRRAANASDVKALIRRFDYTVLAKAWNSLDPLTRSTLELMRAFSSQHNTPEILPPDLCIDDIPGEREPQPVRDSQADPR